MAVALEASNVVQHLQCRLTAGSDSQVVLGFLVGGISPTSADSAIVQAMSCPGLPAWGEQLAGITPGLYALEFNPRPFKNSKTKMWVLVTYRPPQFTAIGETVFELRGTTKQVVRAYANGQKLKIPYTTTAAAGQPAVSMRPQTAQISDTVGVGILTADWLAYQDPGPSLLRYRNAINNAPFNGAAKWTVWVSEIVIRKVRFQSGYSVHLEMQYDPETWLQNAYWRDIGGIIPDDIDVVAASTAGPGSGNGYVRGTLKSQKSLNQLTSLIPGSALMPTFT